MSGFANIAEGTYNLLDDSTSVIVTNRSASGKTTIAKILYAFLTGELKEDVIGKDFNEATAELLYGDKKYRISVSVTLNDKRSISIKQMDKIGDQAYFQYLVLTESGPMYSFYFQPSKFDLNAIVDKVVARPNTKEIDEELRRIEQSIGVIPRMVKDYEDSLLKYEQELSEVEAKIAEVEKLLETATKSSSRVEILLKKKKIDEDLNRIDSLIKKYEDEINSISTELQSVDYDRYRRRRKELGEEIEKLERSKLILNNIKELLKTLGDTIRKLVSVSDVLSDLNIYLFGSPIDPKTMETYVNDCEVALEEVTAKLADIDTKLSAMRQELNKVDSNIRHYNERFNRRETLLNEVQKLKDERRKLEFERMRIEREISKLLHETGKTVSDLLSEYVTQEEIQRLLKERDSLMLKKNELLTTIKSLRNMIESVKREQAEAEALRKRYEELKKIKNDIEMEYQRKRAAFIESFKESLIEAIRFLNNEKIYIKHFDPKTIEFRRPGQTYSKSERLLITSLFIFSLAKALTSLGYPVPFVVIDVLSPIDSQYEKALITLSKSVPAKTIILMTKNEHAVYPIR